MYLYRIIFIYFIIISIFILNVNSTHIQGAFRTTDFFSFLIKFGFQKTDKHHPKETHGYMFGNITSKHNFTVPITFAVLDRNHFLEYYGNRSVYDKSKACKLMFNKLNQTAYNSKCNPTGLGDFLRQIPCPKNQLCADEDSPSNVIKNYQFTYHIENSKQPKFWYVTMVACYQNSTTCKWEHYEEYDKEGNIISREIQYDFWLVNGNPNQSTYNPLVYQFSFDRQNTLELYLLFWLCYDLLVPLQLHAARLQKHPVTKLFTTSLILDFIALCLILVHTLKFAIDGVGYPNVALAGDIFDIFSRTTFMLLLLLLAKGWAVTRMELSWKPLVFAIWLCYGVVHILLYVWNLTEVDIIEDIDEYQTWPGWLIIVFRTLIMLWFLYELRITMLYEHNSQKLNFLLHFGASSLVWFIYLPIIALIALQVSALWRYKLLVGITYSADCIAYCVMAHLLWPTRSEQYFLLAERSCAEIDELDEFNEAPHVLNNSTPPYSALATPPSSQSGRRSLEINGDLNDVTNVYIDRDDKALIT